MTLSAASEQVVTVAFDTVEEGSAISGSDYAPASGTVTFSPGTRRQTIEVVTRQDEFVESEETFTVTLSDPTAATLEDETGVGTIVDDDPGGGFARTGDRGRGRRCPRAAPPHSS